MKTGKKREMLIRRMWRMPLPLFRNNGGITRSSEETEMRVLSGREVQNLQPSDSHPWA
jgi:hypothetical protein